MFTNSYLNKIMKYYVITAAAAQEMKLTLFRRRTKGGYIVTSGDMVTAPEHVWQEAREVTELQAKELLKTSEQ